MVVITYGFDRADNLILLMASRILPVFLADFSERHRQIDTTLIS